MTAWVCIFGKSLLSCLFINTEYLDARFVTNYKTHSDATLWYNFLVNNLYIDQFQQKNLILFATVKFHIATVKFYISYEKRLDLGEQRKIPCVNITKVCAIYQLIENCHTCWLRNICYHMYSVVASSLVGIYVRKKQKNRSIELNTKHSDISTKVGPEENQWGYNGCILSWPLNVPVMFTCQSNDPSEFIQIYQLILIRFDTCMYRISRRISFKSFLPTCFRYQIHSGIEHGHDLGNTKNRWIRIRKS